MAIAETVDDAEQSAGSDLFRQRIRSAWLFLTPMLVVLAIVAGWPLLRSIYFSFTNASLTNISAAEWVGFENYLSITTLKSGRVIYDGLLVDPLWWKSVWNTVRFSVVSVISETIIGMMVALVLNAEFRGRGIVRAAILVPWAIPTIVSAKMWAWMLNDQFGIINDILLNLGLISQKIAWTANPDTAMLAVLMVDIWKTTPFMALLILAGLQMIPGDIYEAAKIDGVHPVKVFFRVTLPLCRSSLIAGAILAWARALGEFGATIMFAGNRQGVTQTMPLAIYERFGAGDLNAALILSAVLLMTSIVFLVLVRILGESGSPR